MSDAPADQRVYAFIDLHGNPVPYDGVSPVKWRQAAYVLVVRDGRDGDGKVLMVEPLHTARWELPGGGVEVHELLVEGAARECYEETGYRFVPKSAAPFYVGEGFICWNPERGDYYHMIAAIFEGSVADEPGPSWTPDPAEIRRVAWLDPTELTTENTHPNFWTVLKRAGLVG